MSTNPAATTGHLEPTVRRRLWFSSLPQVKRRPRLIKGGESELLQQLGEVRRVPSEPGLPVDRTLARWRWM
jgi:hypothetical protein